jgi:hypothetical protein
LLDSIPGRARERSSRKDTTQCKQPPTMIDAATRRSRQHERHERGINHVAPIARPQTSPSEENGR